MILIESPWLALVPAVVFGLAAWRSGRGLTWIAAISWAVYAGYEWAMHERILCTGECNIRVDLLLLYPILLVLSLVGGFAAGRGRASTGRA